MQAQSNIAKGDFYFTSKKNYRAAQRRYMEATRWDPASPVAFLKLGEADEKLKDFNAARKAYEKCLALEPKGRNAEEAAKRLGRLK